MEHICHFPCSFCGISFDCMCQCIHTCRSGQALRHRRHHFRINNCDDRHIMWVNTYEFTFLFNISNNVVNSNFCSGSCCCRNCNDRYARFLCRCSAFQTSYIFKFRIRNDNSNCFCSIHRRTATDCNDIICTGFFKCGHTILYVLDCRVCLNIRVNFVFQTIFFKDICYLTCNIKFNQIRVGTYKSFLKCMCFCFVCDLSDCACSVIRGSIQIDSVCHD